MESNIREADPAAAFDMDTNPELLGEDLAVVVLRHPDSGVAGCDPPGFIYFSTGRGRT